MPTINRIRAMGDSSMETKWAKHRAQASQLTVEGWLDGRRADGGAKGLWRVHDDLYDLSDWLHSHPGGAQWLQYTKGTDITEAFESHHIGPLAKKILPKYFVRSARTVRNSPFTFKEDGFYKIFKARVNDKLKHIEPGPSTYSKRLLEALTTSTVILSILASANQNFTLGTFAGISLTFTTICAHNFFHMRDNWRMYLFNMSLLTVRQWRVSHALSHHLYPNTQHDLEITTIKPFMNYLPSPEKSKVFGVIAAIYSPFLYPFFFFAEAIKRLVQGPKKMQDTICLLLPAFMYLVGCGSVPDMLLMWGFIQTVSSFFFVLIGINAAHHHPDILHEGDAPREDQDWGLFMLDATRDRIEVKGVPSLVLVTFGDHCLHHLLPTVDHAHFSALYPLLIRTCKEFGVEFEYMTTWQLMVGQFKQLIRNEPNAKRPS